MKTLDIVKAPARTEQEAHNRWRNRLQSELAQLNNYRTVILIDDNPADSEETEATDIAKWEANKNEETDYELGRFYE